MQALYNPITQNQTGMLQGIVDRCREQEADELCHYINLKRKVKVERKPELIGAVVITPAGYRCNLACDYCFNRAGSSKSNPAVMNQELLERVIQQVLSTSENPEFIWHGGEPLLAGMDFYKNALRLQEKYGLPLTQARNAIQTNGTLLDESWAAFLKENHFEIGLSLDGPEKLHDAQRKYPSRQGSFRQVMQAVANLNREKKSFGIAATITGEKLCSPEELPAFFIGHRFFRISINPALNRSGLTVSAYAEYMCRLFDAWLNSNEPELQISLFDGLFRAFRKMPLNICWWNGHCPRIIRIDQAGDVWPCCDRYLPYTQYKLGNIRQKNLQEILTGVIYSNFRENFANLPLRCISCKWSHICKGGCAYHRIINGQGEDGGDHLCEAYKQIFHYIFSSFAGLL
ncbi:MAG: radical SAM protein [Candidatus Schekmanbacteria bacterium]|nr:radical SAM protein [Candidatus Schekmanbacteria bacterium]